MARHTLFVIFFSIFLVTTTLAAGPVVPKTKSRNSDYFDQLSPTKESKEWEYLVLSFGKTFFTSNDPKASAGYLSKLPLYSKAGIISADEALVTQKEMDTLGKFGWELVTIVGAIGGDQQMVFKRPYDPERLKLEAIVHPELEHESKTDSIDLIDLDVIEDARMTNTTRRKEEERLKLAIDTIKDYPILKVNVSSKANHWSDSNIEAIVEIDGTNKLLTDNKYRLSDARIMAKIIAQDIYKAAGLRNHFEGISSSTSYVHGEVKITVFVSVSYQGVTKKLAVEKVGGKWSERVPKYR